MTMLIRAPARRGDVIAGRYVIGEVLGAGGMGVVYTATAAPLERTVAIKLPRPELVDNPHMRRRFRREAILGSRLDHPNIVRVYDFAAGDVIYLVMEHVPGLRLGELLTEHGPLPVDTAIEIQVGPPPAPTVRRCARVRRTPTRGGSSTPRSRSLPARRGSRRLRSRTSRANRASRCERSSAASDPATALSRRASCA